MTQTTNDPRSTSMQPVTPDIEAWLATETANGRPRRSLFESMLVVGWQRSSAISVMKLNDQELATFGMLPVQANQPDLAALPEPVRVPIPAIVVDAGDKLVKVVYARQDPALMVFEDLLSSEECEALIADARPRLSRSLTVDNITGGEQLHGDRTSQGMFFKRDETPLVQKIEQRIAKLVSWPIQNGEALQILRYPPGAEYKPHQDYFDPAEPGSSTILTRGGQRVATLIIYLHEPESGGATVFSDIDLQVAPRRGNAVFFSYPRAHTASRALHGGMPVITGEKWIATKWLREREFK
jgi:prolyl 4-hydroxylase